MGQTGADRAMLLALLEAALAQAEKLGMGLVGARISDAIDALEHSANRANRSS